MKKLILGSVLAAIAASPALANGPQPGDANPPGALFQSTPRGWNDDGTPRMGPAAQVPPRTNSAPAALRGPRGWKRTGY